MTAEEIFNSFEWHDATLEEILVDRRNPGESDEVTITMEWTDGSRQRLRFEKCYEVEARMNFGILAQESVLHARCSTECIHLDTLRQKWMSMGVVLEATRCFEIFTNSTGGTIRICAKRLVVVPISD